MGGVHVHSITLEATFNSQLHTFRILWINQFIFSISINGFIFIFTKHSFQINVKIIHSNINNPKTHFKKISSYLPLFFWQTKLANANFLNTILLMTSFFLDCTMYCIVISFRCGKRCFFNIDTYCFYCNEKKDFAATFSSGKINFLINCILFVAVELADTFPLLWHSHVISFFTRILNAIKIRFASCMHRDFVWFILRCILFQNTEHTHTFKAHGMVSWVAKIKSFHHKRKSLGCQSKQIALSSWNQN